MLTVFVVLALLGVCVAGIHLLLKSMGESGVEAAAPGSCKSGRCGVQCGTSREDSPQVSQEQTVLIDEIKRQV